jgi:hypothetical protein
MPVIDQDELKLKDENEVIRAGQADVAQADWKGCAVAVKQFRLGESEFKLAWKVSTPSARTKKMHELMPST